MMSESLWGESLRRPEGDQKRYEREVIVAFDEVLEGLKNTNTDDAEALPLTARQAGAAAAAPPPPPRCSIVNRAPAANGEALWERPARAAMHRP